LKSLEFLPDGLRTTEARYRRAGSQRRKAFDRLIRINARKGWRDQTNWHKMHVRQTVQSAEWETDMAIIKSKALCMLAAAALGTATAQGAGATEAEANALLKGMSDYLARQQTMALTVDTSIEIITSEIEKLQFNSTSITTLKRPNQIRMKREGGFARVEMFYDGKTLTLRDLDAKTYAQRPTAPTIDGLVGELHAGAGSAMPGIDLLLSDPYTALMEDVKSGMVVGEAVINGVRCDHLAYRNSEVDWQIWIRQGAEKVPCKFIITTKTMAAAPQYTVTVTGWKSGQPVTDADLRFQPLPGERKVEPKELLGLDEIPPITEVRGAKK
jgi:hypothetical protein